MYAFEKVLTNINLLAVFRFMYIFIFQLCGKHERFSTKQ